MNGRISEKTALITGATSGLGLATARRFVAEGARVLASGRSAARLEALRAELGPALLTCPADVTSQADLGRLAAAARDAFGSLDILMANAGLGFFAPLEVVDEAFYATQFDVNVKGALFTVQKLLPLLGKGSSVILTASIAGRKGFPNTSVYSASKAAVRSLGRTLAAELGPRGIRVNCVSPGYVATEFQDRAGVDPSEVAAKEAFMKTNAPTRTLSTPEDVAAAALFLASDDARNVTGTEIIIDGGLASV